MTCLSRFFLLFFLSLSLSACADMGVAKRAAEQGDYVTARQNLEKLSDFGIPDAQRRLGRLLLAGQGGPADPERGVKLLELAAMNGETKAFLELGKAYEKGNGVTRNSAKALSFYQKALDHGVPGAAFQIGAYYESLKNGPESLRWYKKSLSEGYGRAAFRLGRLYDRGKIVPPDLAKALAFYYIAREKGSDETSEGITRLENSLKPGRIAESKALVQRLTP